MTNTQSNAMRIVHNTITALFGCAVLFAEVLLHKVGFLSNVVIAAQVVAVAIAVPVFVLVRKGQAAEVKAWRAKALASPPPTSSRLG